MADQRWKINGEMFFSVAVKTSIFFALNPSAKLTTSEIAKMFECDVTHISTRMKPAVLSGAIDVLVPGSGPHKRETLYGIGPVLLGMHERAKQ